jgi:hypothetical protein
MDDLRMKIVDAMRYMEFSKGPGFYFVEWNGKPYQAADTFDLVEEVLADLREEANA